MTGLAAAIVSHAGHAVASVTGNPAAGWLGHRELDLYQWRRGGGLIGPSADVVLITLERDTPRRLSLSRPVFPLPRDMHARLLRGLQQAGARAVIIDLLFTDASVPEEDDALRQALVDVERMHVTLALEPDAASTRADPLAPTGWRYAFLPPAVAPDPLPRHITLAAPVAFDPGGSLQGIILMRPDARTDRLIPHLAFSAMLGSMGLQDRAVWDQGRQEVRAGILRWNVGADGEILLRWTDSPDAFPRYEYSEALSLLEGRGGESPFRDKIVLVGDTTGADTHNTPLGRISGLEFVAHAVNTLLLTVDSLPNPWSLPSNFGWTLVLCVGASYGATQWRRPVVALAVPLAAAAFAPVVSLALWRSWPYTLTPILAVCLTGLLDGLTLGSLTRRFVPSRVREHRGEATTEEATVMFVDFSGSTSLAVRLGPEVARDLMGMLLRRLSECIHSHRGEVERTLGDGMMVVFRPVLPLAM